MESSIVMDNKPRILIVHPISNKNYTGGQRIHLQITKEIPKFANLITLDSSILCPPQGTIWNRSLGRYSYVKLLAKHIEELHPDLVFIDLYWFRSYGLSLLNLPKKIPILSYIQTPEALISGNKIEQSFAPWFYVSNPIKLYWYRLLFSLLLIRSNKILTLGPWLKNFLESTIPFYHYLGLSDKIVITGSGIGISSPILPVSKVSKNVADLADIHVMGVGYVDPYKGVHTLISALAELPKELCPQVDWYGQTSHNPSYYQFCIELSFKLGVSDRVKFYDWISPELMPQIWQNHDVFVSTAPLEGYGLVFQEALSYGLFILAPITGSGQFFIKDQINGILYEDKNPKALAHALQSTPFYVTQISPSERYEKTLNLREYHASLSSPSQVIFNHLT